MVSKKELCRQKIQELLIPINTNLEFIRGNDESIIKDKFIGEIPARLVKVNKFKITKTVITREIYSLFDDDIEVNEYNKNYPITNISWNEANAFCNWIELDLPTEAEWECVCKRNDYLPRDQINKIAWFSQNSKSILHEVCTLNPDENGIFDLYGNVWEWCKDYYDAFYYQKSCTDNPVNNEDTGYKVCRGGSYYSFAEMCRSSFRWKERINYKAKDIGFRVVER